MFISKRVLIIVGAVAVVIVALSVFAFVFFLAQANQTVASEATPTVVPAATATATAKATTRACALGVIQSIGSSSFVVAESKGAKTITVMVDSATVIRKHGADIALNSLMVGEHVRVTSEGVCGKKATSFTAQMVSVVVTSAASPTPAVTPTP